MKTIALANHKGGCAKTTTALNVAVALAMTGSRVLAIDLDPQGNLSASLGADLQELETSHRTAHRLMLDERGDFSDYTVKSRPRLDVIPACLDADAEALLDGQAVSRELLLKQKLSPAQPAYDYCVIDTPPSLRVPTLNALAMSDLTVVPIESSMFALLGLGQLLRTVAKVRRAHAPDMMVMALSTLYTARQNLDKNIRTKVLEKFTEDFVFNTTIPRAVAVGEATATLQAVVETSPESAGAFAFRKLVAEVREVLGDEENRSEAIRRSTR
ncbi:MAG: chromosome partitioning protein [Blastocatellia bacterium]|jgi:chromosome partitioning protein|nr:chromosome partitioning protein [Blastocatellia bacterium]